MHVFSCLRLRSSTGPNVVMLLIYYLLSHFFSFSFLLDVSESPRKESNLRARVRSPVLCPLSYRGRLEGIGPPGLRHSAHSLVMVSSGAVKSGRCCGSSSGSASWSRMGRGRCCRGPRRARPLRL